MASDDQGDSSKKQSIRTDETQNARSEKVGQSNKDGASSKAASSSSSKTKKPVTIDLEAEKVESVKPLTEEKEPLEKNKKPSPDQEVKKTRQVVDSKKGVDNENNLLKNKQEKKADKVTPSASGPKKRSGFSLLLAAIIGGLVSSALIFGAAKLGFLPFEDLQNDLENLKERLSILETKSDELALAQEKRDDAEFNDFANRLSRLEKEDFVKSSDLKPLKERLPVENVTAELSKDLQTLETRLGNLERLPNTNIGNTAPSSNGSNFNAEFSKKLDGLEERLDGFSIPKVDKADITLLQKDVLAANEKVQTMLEQVSKLSERLGEFEKTVERDSLSGETILTIAHQTAVLNLHGQALSGEAFVGAYAQVEKIGLEKTALLKLEPFKENGLPSKERLINDLNTLIVKARHENNDEAKQGNISAFDKLLRNARSAINLRNLGDETPQNQAFIKIEKAAKTMDPDLFVEGFNALTDRQKALFNDWKQAFEAHLALNDLLKEPSFKKAAE